MKYTLEQCLEQQKKVDAGIKHNGEYMPWLAGIKEVIEMCDHLSMIDTWKNQPAPNMKQAFMELVDVFAFAMSCCALFGYIPAANYMYNPDEYTKEEVISILISSFADSSLGEMEVTITCISTLAVCMFKEDIEGVYYYYMGKQTLTRFRQANGYKVKDGYTKQWGGREDNEYLTDALESGVEIDDLYEHLEDVYTRIVKAKEGL